jgi:hypothetical protein
LLGLCPIRCSDGLKRERLDKSQVKERRVRRGQKKDEFPSSPSVLFIESLKPLPVKLSEGGEGRGGGKGGRNLYTDSQSQIPPSSSFFDVSFIFSFSTPSLWRRVLPPFSHYPAASRRLLCTRGCQYTHRSLLASIMIFNRSTLINDRMINCSDSHPRACCTFSAFYIPRHTYTIPHIRKNPI